MRKSVTAFVFGLIGSIFCLAWGFFLAVIGNLGGCVSSLLSDGPIDSTLTTLYWLGWLCFIGGIFGIVGASNCFRKARTGAIWLTVATAMCAPLHIYLFVQMPSIGGTFIFTRIVIVLLPVVFLALSTVFAWIAKKVDVPVGNTSYNVIANNVNESKQDDSALEKELLKLKATLDKGLITKEEYEAARKKIIEKYM